MLTELNKLEQQTKKSKRGKKANKNKEVLAKEANTDKELLAKEATKKKARRRNGTATGKRCHWQMDGARRIPTGKQRASFERAKIFSF